MTTDHDCDAARAWLSAFRDCEALDDPEARAHLRDCVECARWGAAVDRLSRASRVRPAGSPDVSCAAIAAFTERLTASRSRWQEAARALLGFAGASGLGLFAVGLLGLPGTAAVVAGHVGQDLSGLHAALSVGFLLAAWRPLRYGRGLLPVSTAAALVVLLPTLPHAGATAAAPLAEAAHVPLLLGLVGLLLLFDPSTRRRGVLA